MSRELKPLNLTAPDDWDAYTAYLETDGNCYVEYADWHCIKTAAEGDAPRVAALLRLAEGIPTEELEKAHEIRLTRFAAAPEEFGEMNSRWLLCDCFGNMETEISALWLIRFAQNRGQGWKPFTYADINAFYGRKHKDGFWFNKLIDEWIICSRSMSQRNGRMLPDDTFTFTEKFVARAFESVKKNRPVPTTPTSDPGEGGES